jgi:hypothetical protein
MNFVSSQRFHISSQQKKSAVSAFSNFKQIKSAVSEMKSTGSNQQVEVSIFSIVHSGSNMKK